MEPSSSSSSLHRVTSPSTEQRRRMEPVPSSLRATTDTHESKEDVFSELRLRPRAERHFRHPPPPVMSCPAEQDWEFLETNLDPKIANSKHLVQRNLDPKIVDKITTQHFLRLKKKTLKSCMGGYLYLEKDDSVASAPDLCEYKFRKFFGRSKVNCSMCKLNFCEDCCCKVPKTIQKNLPSWIDTKETFLCAACVTLSAEYREFNLSSERDMCDIRNDALKFNQGKIRRTAPSKRAIRRKYRDELDRIVAKDQYIDINEDIVLKCLLKVNGDVRLAEKLLTEHERYVLHQQERLMEEKTLRREERFKRTQQALERKSREIESKTRAVLNEQEQIQRREKQSSCRRRQMEEEATQARNLSTASYSLAKARAAEAEQTLLQSCQLKEETKNERLELQRKAEEARDKLQQREQLLNQKFLEEKLNMVRDQSIAWQCDVGSGNWIDYEESTALLLERSHEHRLPVVFNRKGHQYHIDWDTSCQVNTSTGVCRTIRRRQFNSSHVAEKLEAERKKLQADFAAKEKKQEKKLREKEQAERKKLQADFAAKEQAKNKQHLEERAAVALEHMEWQCFANGSWSAYPSNINKILEVGLQTWKHQNDKNYTVNFTQQFPSSSQTFSYSVTYSKESDGNSVYVQTNTKTNVSRDVRRERLDDGTWDEHGQKIDKYTTKYVCVSNKKGEDTLGNKHFSIASTQFEKYIQGKIVHKVEYWENRKLVHRFQQKRRQFHADGKSTKTLQVFHGCPDDVIPKIMQGGFLIGGKKGHKATNGTVHGQGVYTATGVDTGISYGRGIKKLILCKALIGAQVGIHEDGGGDSWKPRADWVVFKTSEQLLPMYVVHFTDK